MSDADPQSVDDYLAEKHADRLGKVSVGAELAQRAAALTKAGQFAM